MQEPFKRVQIIDETTGIDSGVSTDSLNIATFIIAPTGPVERTTVSSQADLVSKFLVGNNFSASDDVTIQHVGSLVTSIPVDVMRVDSSMLREGITSTGLRVIADTNFNLLDYYTLAKINDQIVDAMNQVYLVFTYDSVKYCFYAGESQPTGEDVSNAEFFQVPTENNDKTDIVGFLRNLNNVINNSLTDNPGLLIAVGDGTAIINSQYVGGLKGAINLKKSPISGMTEIEGAASQGEYVAQGDYIKIGGYTLYYAGDGTSPVDTLTNPIAIESGLNNKSAFTVAEFMNTVTEELLNNDDLQDPVGIYGNYGIQLTLASPVAGEVEESITLASSSNLDPYIHLEAMTSQMEEMDTYTGARLEAACSLDQLEAGYITLTCNGVNTSLWFGESGNTVVPSTVQTSGYHVGTEARTAQTFIMDCYVAFANAAIAGNPAYTVSENTTAITLFYQTENEPGIGINSTNGRITCEESTVDFTKIKFSTGEAAKAFQTYDTLWFNIDDYTYYCGDVAKITDVRNNRRRISASAMTINNFMDELVSAASSQFTLSKIDNGIVIQADSEDGRNVSATPGLIVENSIVTYDQRAMSDAFAVFAKFPSTDNMFSYEYTKNDDGSYNFVFTYNGEDDEETLSFDPNAVDGFGTSLYYTKINEGSGANGNFYLMQLDGTEDKPHFTSKTFGAYFEQPEVTATNISAAMNKLRDYTDKYYTYLWDAGYTSPVVAQNLIALGQELNTQVILSMPFDYKEADEFISYRQSVGADTFEGYIVGPSYRNSTLGTFLSPLSCSLAFLNKKVGNYNSVSPEFAPVFGPNKGIVSTPNLTCQLSKEDREKLLDYQINFVIPSTTGYQINFNTSMQTVTSYLSEEQNVQFANAIAHECDDYAEGLIGEVNDEALWNRVVSELTSRLTQRVITNKSPAPRALRVLMNAELNPTEIIEARKAVFQVDVILPNSIAYVTAYVKVVRLGTFE